MTRIRLSEWLFAGLLVFALHAMALTGWAVLAPAPEGGSIESPRAAAADPVILAVKLDHPEAQPAASPAMVPTPAASSNEIIVVPTDPAPLSGPGQSTAMLAIPQDSLLPDQAVQEPSSQDQASQDKPQTAAIRPVGQPITATGEPAAGQAARLPSRDPVPLPKPKPLPPAAPGESDAGAAPASETSIAAVETARPAVESAPASAAHSGYYRQLLAEVMQAQIYPQDAKRENKKGTVYLQIVVQRTGVIKSYDIVKSSGFQELDDAAVQTLVRANPVQPFPDGITDDELRFGLPMRFGS